MRIQNKVREKRHLNFLEIRNLALMKPKLKEKTIGMDGHGAGVQQSYLLLTSTAYQTFISWADTRTSQKSPRGFCKLRKVLP